MIFDHVLLTGAAGFLGLAIARQSVNAGLTVTATDRSANAKFPGAEFILADILDPLFLSGAMFMKNVGYLI